MAGAAQIGRAPELPTADPLLELDDPAEPTPLESDPVDALEPLALEAAAVVAPPDERDPLDAVDELERLFPLEPELEETELLLEEAALDELVLEAFVLEATLLEEVLLEAPLLEEMPIELAEEAAAAAPPVETVAVPEDPPPIVVDAATPFPVVAPAEEAPTDVDPLEALVAPPTLAE